MNYIPKQIDGIFSSFAIAYFPNKMEQILKNWLDKLKDLGMEIILDENLEDSELTDSGIISDEIYTMWENRLNRLSFDKFFQKNEIESIKSDFLSLLKSSKHINQTKVKFIIAKKD